MIGKSSMIFQAKRGCVTGCKRACCGACEVHPGARGAMPSVRAALQARNEYKAGVEPRFAASCALAGAGGVFSAFVSFDKEMRIYDKTW